ncbi:DUF1727 domain-containing protein [Amycolatopsis sp. CA-230715]|uniref:DUF1727 domain-containing protein n=1 Tax=Amycolatopsis sp. CA-230715 TaxID=2745196 RepID=UPI002F3E6F86
MASHKPLRTRTSIAAGQATAWLSRRVGFGGGMIGGRVALKLDPHALRRLGRDRTVLLVSGTNGKTTTTLMLATALGGAGEVASNSDGANMPDGLLAALVATPHAPCAVLEVDESYLPWVAAQVDPAVVVLLNLSRDQLDRVGEVRATEREIRAAIGALPFTSTVANCDDVLITSAAADAAHPVWVGTGGHWHEDAGSCPRCGGAIRHHDDGWACRCGLARPSPSWSVAGDRLVDPLGRGVDLGLRLPGTANRANAALAIAAASCAGVPPELAAARIREISDIGGRYRVVRRQRHSVRLMLAKNPAGWGATIPILAEDTPVVIAVNAREADGRDTSWLWDVPFERLRGKQVVATGERCADLAVRLRYAEVAHRVHRDPVCAVDSLQGGEIELVANYTAFRDLVGRLPA